MKKPAILKIAAAVVFVFAMGCFAQAQVIITPTEPESTSNSSSQTQNNKTVLKCIATTTCSINEQNELVNCEQKEEITTFELEASKGIITIIKPLKRQKYNIEAFEHEPTTGTLQLKVYNDSGEFLKYAMIIIFASENLISVEYLPSLGDSYDDNWDPSSYGTMEIYDIEH